MQNLSDITPGAHVSTLNKNLTETPAQDYILLEGDKDILLHEFNMAGLPDGDPLEMIQEEITHNAANHIIFNQLLLDLKYATTKEEKAKVTKLIIKAIGCN